MAARAHRFAKAERVILGDEVVTVVGTREHGDEPGYDVRTRAEVRAVPESWLREPVARERAERLLAVLRDAGAPTSTAADFRASKLYDAKNRVRGTPTPEQTVALLRHWYTVPAAEIDAAHSMRTHGVERGLLEELALVLGGSFEALRAEMRALYPAMAAWEAGADERAAKGPSRVAEAMKKGRKKKPAPLP